MQGCRETRSRVVTGKRKAGTDAIQIVGMNVIPESDIYRLAAKSELPGAEKFEAWIFDEVNAYLEQGWKVKLVSACAMEDSANSGQAYVVLEK